MRPERILAAIGEPTVVDTAKDARLGRIFMNRTIRVYPAFADDFFGMEETVERIVAFFRHASQGLEERKQILYLLGPVGGGKSSLAERPEGAHGGAIPSTCSRPAMRSAPYSKVRSRCSIRTRWAHSSKSATGFRDGASPG